MDNSEQFNVRWNNYPNVLQSSFPKMLNKSWFVDVTLTCEGQSFQCHKLVLSACSSYFEQLLTENPCPHPIIFLRDMKPWEVQALVHFMYRGEVSVNQDKLASLVQAAEALQIKGLAGSKDAVPEMTSKIREKAREKRSDTPPAKRRKAAHPVPKADAETPAPAERVPVDGAAAPVPEEECDVKPTLPLCVSDEKVSTPKTNDAEDSPAPPECDQIDDGMEMMQYIEDNSVENSEIDVLEPGPSGVSLARASNQVSRGTKKGKLRTSKGESTNMLEVILSCDSESPESEVDGLTEVEIAVLLTPGPYTTLRYLRRYVNALRGAQLEHVCTLFHKLAIKGYGSCQAVERTLVFFKKPSEMLQPASLEHIEPWLDAYDAAYAKRNSAITNHQDDKLKAAHPYFKIDLGWSDWNHA